MPLYWIKNSDSEFDHATQPEGFCPLTSRENKFFLVESPTIPVGEFIVEFPPELYENYALLSWKNNKKVYGDPFNGKVAYSDVIDARNRRAIRYTQEQLDQRRDIWKWIAVNLFVPDRERITGDSATTTKCLTEIDLISTDTDMCQYIVDNLYYDIY